VRAPPETGRNGLPHIWLWVAFNGLAFAALAIDLGVFHRRPHEIRPREAAIGTAVWVGLAAVVNLGVLVLLGRAKALEFLTGYLIEESLSVDNIFVFVLIFRYFSVPKAFQHRVLFWGILGAVVLRGAFIIGGITLLRYFEWLTYILGLLLIYGGIGMLRQEKTSVDPSKNKVVKVFRRFFPVLQEYDGARILSRREGRLVATPLMIVLIVVETTDLVFALDSIPAILAISRHSFIVYASNISAILGLRSLYFLFAHIVERLRYLHVGLACILCFVGLKMVSARWIPISTGVSLVFVALTLAVAIASSLLLPDRRAKDSHDEAR
jgi:tellurite resistance protein TerC